MKLIFYYTDLKQDLRSWTLQPHTYLYITFLVLNTFPPVTSIVDLKYNAFSFQVLSSRGISLNPVVLSQIRSRADLKKTRHNCSCLKTVLGLKRRKKGQVVLRHHHLQIWVTSALNGALKIPPKFFCVSTPSPIKLRLCFFNKRKVSSPNNHTNKKSRFWRRAKEAQ